MILTRENFWSHVARRSTSFTAIIFLQNLRNAHICNSEVALLIQNQILWLNVPMDNILFMHVFQSEYEARDQKFALCFCKLFLLNHVVPKIAACQQIRHEIQKVSILKRVVHVAEERVM